MAQHEEGVRYTCDTASEVVMRLFFRNFLERQPMALNVAMGGLSTFVKFRAYHAKSASLLLPVIEARQFIATLLAARGINTWAQAVHLTEHSPCFQGVPEWLVTRTLMTIERMKAQDATYAVYDIRTSQASRKDL
ncbi:hypothetical protein JKP88DRAFT_254870 [Tribonema minus]|uniref:Uncharacterized protein n=1 Tax=Tribonema minus TaxID=303371 RepID=A0A836CHN1_9STRA|nr:hypothetical protein JKP88DRAFT_254870 [Tribonema minus]